MKKLIQLLSVVFFAGLVTQVTADTDDAGHGKDSGRFIPMARLNTVPLKTPIRPTW